MRLPEKEDIKFQIDQLRKDKIIYAVESVACSMAIFLLISFLSVLDPESSGFVVPAGLIISIGYWLFTVYGNTVRFIKIKDLEKKLKLKQ